jgi:hypothetical protein
LTGHGYVKRDFCRYSSEFAEQDAPDLPEFGGEFTDLSDDDRSAVLALADWEAKAVYAFHLFRFHDKTVFYVGEESAELDSLPAQLRLPRSFRIDSRIPLPDSVQQAEAFLALVRRQTVGHGDRIGFEPLARNPGRMRHRRSTPL